MPSAAKTRQPLGQLPADGQLRLAIGLPLRDQPGLTSFLQQIYAPASPQYHRYLTPGEFTLRFGPTESDYQSVVEFARSNRLTIAARHANRLILDVTGSVGDIQRALGVTLQVYNHPSEPRTFYAPAAEPAVPANLPILHISGLDNYIIPHPAGLSPSGPKAPNSPVPQTGSGPAGAYRGNDFRGAYARSVSLTGSGQLVGLLEFDGYYQADVASYFSQASLPGVPIINVTLDGFDGTPGGNNVEAALDVEMVASMAPGVAAIIVYEEGPSGLVNDILSRMAIDNLAKQLSASWTFNVDATTEQIFLEFAAQGQSYFNASGDSGAYSGKVTSPADDPNVTVVGGTILNTTGPGGAWASETVWNRGGTGRALGATGGGISTTYVIPSWQKPVDMSTNHGSSTMRNLPDVAAVADGVWVTYDNGSSETVGGTSCSSPLWAAFTALVNQQAANFGRPPVGFLNPALYNLGLAAGYATNFHDIVSGNNTNSGSPSNFFAVPGYDLCTGWGSPFGQNLINALAPRVPSPLITNSAATIIAEGCLPANGAIDPGETVTVNFGLKNLGGFKTTNLAAVLQVDAGVLWPSASQNYGALAPGAAASRPFTFTAAGVCGGSLRATMQLQDGATDLGKVTFTFPLGKPQTIYTQNFDSVTAPALPSDWSTTVSTNSVSTWVTSTTIFDSSPNAAFADEPPTPGIEELISPVFSIVSPKAQLSFRNSYNTEIDPNQAGQAYDGGLLEIQIGTNDFVDILAAGGSFIVGGYDSTIITGTNSDNPLTGRRVWAGLSGGFITTTVNLPASAAGQNIQLKWRFGLDSGNFYGGHGWYIDNVSIQDGASCCNPSADLAVLETVSPEPVAPGQPLTYSVTITNLGPGSAFGVLVTNLVSGSAVFSSGSPGCTYTNGDILCVASMLAGNDSTNFTFSIIPTTSDSITNTSVVWAFTPDPDLSNNQVSIVSTVATNTPPVIYLPVTNAVAVSGGLAMLQATAYGTAPLGYQWFFNGGIIPGETAPALSLTNVQPAQSGAYSVTVTNLNGGATSAPVQLLVVVPPSLQLSGFGPTAGSLSVSLPSTTGLNYYLEYKNSLSDSNWVPVLPASQGTGQPLTLVDTNVFGVPARFYRVTVH